MQLTKDDLEALTVFTNIYPTWWWKLGWCDVSRDFDCAPQASSPEIELIEHSGDCWDAGFSCDSTGSFADAIKNVMRQIMNAKSFGAFD